MRSQQKWGCCEPSCRPLEQIWGPCRRSWPPPRLLPAARQQPSPAQRLSWRPCVRHLQGPASLHLLLLPPELPASARARLGLLLPLGPLQLLHHRGIVAC